MVGVIANLAVHLGNKVCWNSFESFKHMGVPLVFLASVGLARWKLGVTPVILAGVLFGVVRCLHARCNTRPLDQDGQEGDV